MILPIICPAEFEGHFAVVITRHHQIVAVNILGLPPAGETVYRETPLGVDAHGQADAVTVLVRAQVPDVHLGYVLDLIWDIDVHAAQVIGRHCQSVAVDVLGLPPAGECLAVFGFCGNAIPEF